MGERCALCGRNSLINQMTLGKQIQSCILVDLLFSKSKAALVFRVCDWHPEKRPKSKIYLFFWKTEEILGFCTLLLLGPTTVKSGNNSE